MSIQEEYLSQIAEAIKIKLGDTTPIVAEQFAEKIASISSGGGGGAIPVYPSSATVITFKTSLLMDLEPYAVIITTI